MSDDLVEAEFASVDKADLEEQPDKIPEEIAELRSQFEARLITANLRTDAIRAGMIDLDGLKLIDLSSVRLGQDDAIVGGRKIMDDLRRNKPWLFTVKSSSSAAVAPVSQPARQKSAVDMTDEEYATARTAVTRHNF